ncbi:MAG: hypothetical protein WC255_06150, partial [Bacteroidales bacterium]
LVFPILFLRFCAHEKPCRSCCEELRHSRNKGMPRLSKPVACNRKHPRFRGEAAGFRSDAAGWHLSATH